LIIEIYSRPGCHLCDEAKKTILEAAGKFPFDLVERNVQENPQWEAEHGNDIPVVFIDGRKAFKHHVPPAALARYLSKNRGQSPQSPNSAK
jgi:glutaredoxin